MNVHLASGQNATQERNEHLKQILSDAFQARGSQQNARPPKQGFQMRSMHTVAGHHLAIIFGDFNSRLDLQKKEDLGPQARWTRGFRSTRFYLAKLLV